MVSFEVWDILTMIFNSKVISVIRTVVVIYTIVRKKIRKRRLFKKVQAFCEEKVLRYLFGVYWYAESKNQC